MPESNVSPLIYQLHVKMTFFFTYECFAWWSASSPTGRCSKDDPVYKCLFLKGHLDLIWVTFQQPVVIYSMPTLQMETCMGGWMDVLFNFSVIVLNMASEDLQPH